MYRLVAGQLFTWPRSSLEQLLGPLVATHSYQVWLVVILQLMSQTAETIIFGHLPWSHIILVVSTSKSSSYYVNKDVLIVIPCKHSTPRANHVLYSRTRYSSCDCTTFHLSLTTVISTIISRHFQWSLIILLVSYCTDKNPHLLCWQGFVCQLRWIVTESH